MTETRDEKHRMLHIKYIVIMQHKDKEHCWSWTKAHKKFQSQKNLYISVMWLLFKAKKKKMSGHAFKIAKEYQRQKSRGNAGALYAHDRYVLKFIK